MPRSPVSRRRLLGGAVAAGTDLLAGATPAIAAAPSATYRIDMHAHFLPPEYRAALLTHGYLTIGGYPTPDWSPESALEFMGRNGIAAQALSIAELDFALDQLKLDGVVPLSAYDGVYLGDPRFEPLMAALNRHKAYVFVHPAELPDDAKPDIPLPDFLYEFTFDTTRAATLLMYSGTLKRYPDIRFQLAHAGGTVPFLAHRLGILAQTAAADPAPGAMRSVLAAGRKEHIVFGSDWPFSALTLSGSGDPQPELEQTFTGEERLQVERANALRELPRLTQAIG